MTRDTMIGLEETIEDLELLYEKADLISITIDTMREEEEECGDTELAELLSKAYDIVDSFNIEQVVKMLKEAIGENN